MAALPSLKLLGSTSVAELIAYATQPGDNGVTVPSGTDDGGVLARDKAKGEPGELIAALTPAKAVFVGIGDGSARALRKAGAATARRAKTSASLSVDLRGLVVSPEAVRGLVEGLSLAVYGFTQKPSAEPRTLSDITVVVDDAAGLKKAFDTALTVVRATAAARDLVNTPPGEKTPAWLATQAKALLKGLPVIVRDEKVLRAEGWG